MSAVRYPASMMVRARELREAGWSLRDIARLVEKETGRRPGATTVALWCYPPDRQRARRGTLNTHSARERAKRYTPNQRFTPEWKLERMRELFLRGVSYKAIGIVAGIWWGEPLSASQVRSRLEGKHTYKRATERSVA